MLRGTYPLKFNNTEIPFPKSYSEDSQIIETVKQSEAGTDLVSVTRRNKLHASMTFKCLASWVATFATFEALDSFLFYRFNPRTGTYESRTVRMRNFKHSLENGSQDLTAVDGVWSVSFDLEEF